MSEAASERPSEAASQTIAGPTAVAATAGELLRAARERQGLDIGVMATSMKVAQRKLELLESNRHDELPDATFARALALSMCRVLKIDAEPVLSRLPRPAAHELDQVSLGLNAPFKDRGGRSEGLDWRRMVNLQTLAAVGLVAAAAAVYWMPMGLWPRWGAPAATRVVSSSIPGSGVALAPPQSDVATASTPEAPAASSPQAATAGSNVVDTVFSSPATPASVPVAGGMLMLRAAAETWIEVRDGGGRVLLSRSLAPGEAAGLDGSLPLRLVVGNAEATQVTFRGQPVTLAATRDNVARLELK